MTTKETTIYKCDFCGKIYLSKKWCEKHEPICKRNPENFQKCLEFCSFFEKRKIKYLFENPFISKEEEKDAFFCNKKQTYLYPFWCKNPILQEDIIGEIPNEPMRKKCDDYICVF